MSVSWDVGFRSKPELGELDQFMQSLGYRIPTSSTPEFTRMYVFDDDSVSREIEFFYQADLADSKELFDEMAGEVLAYGNLKTYSVETTYLDADERLKIIEEKGVKTQHDCYRHLSPKRLKWYETALALRDHFDAIVLSEQTGEEINPDKPFPNVETSERNPV